jgi:hypothetical protein
MSNNKTVAASGVVFCSDSKTTDVQANSGIEANHSIQLSESEYASTCASSRTVRLHSEPGNDENRDPGHFDGNNDDVVSVDAVRHAPDGGDAMSPRSGQNEKRANFRAKDNGDDATSPRSGGSGDVSNACAIADAGCCNNNTANVTQTHTRSGDVNNASAIAVSVSEKAPSQVCNSVNNTCAIAVSEKKSPSLTLSQICNSTAHGDDDVALKMAANGGSATKDIDTTATTVDADKKARETSAGEARHDGDATKAPLHHGSKEETQTQNQVSNIVSKPDVPAKSLTDNKPELGHGIPVLRKKWSFGSPMSGDSPVAGARGDQRLKFRGIWREDSGNSDRMEDYNTAWVDTLLEEDAAGMCVCVCVVCMYVCMHAWRIVILRGWMRCWRRTLLVCVCVCMYVWYVCVYACMHGGL